MDAAAQHIRVIPFGEILYLGLIHLQRFHFGVRQFFPEHLRAGQAGMTESEIQNQNLHLPLLPRPGRLLP